MTELTAIDGVGPSRAAQLREHGYDDVEAVASAAPDELDDLLDRTSGSDLIEAAYDVDGLDLDGRDESDESATTETTFEPGFDREIIYHLIAFVVRDEIEGRRTNDADRVRRSREIVEELISGEPYQFDYDHLNIIHRASSQMESEYRSTRGLREIVGEARSCANYFQEQRQQLRDE